MQVQNPSLFQICLKKKMTRWRQKKELSGKEAVIDKELLEAFRCFDWNQTGYIRVEDMRLIIHSLGTFLSHTEVKELVQSALLENNTGRDDCIPYNKLVRMNHLIL